MISIQEVNLVLRVVTSAGSFAFLGSVNVVLYNMLFHYIFTIHSQVYSHSMHSCCELGCCGQHKLATVCKT